MDANTKQADPLEGVLLPHEPEAGPDDVPGIPTSALLLPIVSMAFDALAPAWAVTEPEKRSIAESYGALIDKYMPDGLDKYGIEFAALLTTAAVIGPRMHTPRQHKKQAAENANAE